MVSFIFPEYSDMKIIVVIIILFSGFFSLSAQDIKGSVTLKARENLLSKLPQTAVYQLNNFSDATVQFKDGKLSRGRINICLVDNSVRFIDDGGDTLKLSNAHQVMRIVVEDTVFLQVQDCFIKQLLVYGQLFLGEQKILTLEKAELEDGYSSIPATSTAKIGKMVDIDPNRVYEVETQFDYTLTGKLVLSDGTDIYPSRLSSFIKLFPEKKKSIREYAKKHNTDFKNKLSLMDLFLFCADNDKF